MSKSNQKNKVILISESNLLRVISWLFFALLFVPLINLNFLPNPATFSKMLLAYLLIEGMVAVWLLLVSQNHDYAPFISTKNSKEWLRDKRNWLALVFTGYVGTAFISALLATDRELAIFGTPDWTSGWIMLLHLLGLFFVLKTTMREAWQWRTFLKINLVVGLISVAYALAQRLEGGIPFSFFSNRAYLAGYLLFAIFQAVILWRWNMGEKNKQESRWKWLCFFSILFNASIILFVLDIRGAIFGLIGGSFGAGMLYLIAHRKKNIRRLSLVALAGLILIGGILSFSLVGSGKIATLFQRSETVRIRLVLWKIGMQAFADKPLFGYGPENYYIPFEKHFDQTYYTLQNKDGTVTSVAADQPHNKIIEVLATTGIFGAIFYLAIFLALGWSLYRRYFETKDTRLLALFGMWVAYFIQNLFIFDTITTFIMLACCLAFSTFLLDDTLGRKDNELDGNFPISRTVLVVSVAGFALVVFFLVIKPAISGYYGTLATEALQKGNLSEMLRQLERQEGESAFYVQRRSVAALNAQLASVLIQNEPLKDNQKAALEKFITFGEEIVAKEPYHFFAIESLNRLYNIAGGEIDKSYYAKNVALQEAALERGVRRLDLYYFLAEAYIGLGQNDKAIEACQKAVDLNPDFAYSHYVFALGYFLMNEDAKGLAQVDQAIALKMRNVGVFQVYLDHAKKIKDYDREVYAANQLTIMDWKNPQAYFALAAAYTDKGDTENANATLETIITKFPDRKAEAEKLLK